MVKWLMISLLVLVSFTGILLGLGYLLNENEKRVTKLKQELEQQAENTAPTEQADIIVVERANSSSHLDTVKPSVNRRIIGNNLTCVADEQCLVVEAEFSDMSCTVAVNVIGAAKLAKAKKDLSEVGQCLNYSTELAAVCEKNLCTLKVLTSN